MAGNFRAAFAHPFLRSHRPAALVAALSLAAAVAVPLATTGAANADSGPCAVTPRADGSWVMDDYTKLVAGTDTGAHKGYSMLGAAQDMGAGTFYKNNYFGYDYKNKRPIDVAVIDTGTAPVLGLNRGNVWHGPDFSFEAKATKLAHNDTNGHGTMMASLIAGSEYAPPTTKPAQNTAPPAPFNVRTWGQFNGIAPGARIISVKAGDSQGGVDVTQVIAAIDWVVAHADTNDMHIRVINLSYGVAALDDWTQDALSYAVDQAWKKNIVVVASAGNSGATKTNNGNEYYTASWSGVLSPAYNQKVIAVGSYDTGGTPKFDVNGAPLAPGVPADSVSSYSTSDTTSKGRTVDVVAPGDHVIGLHATGSFMDDQMYEQCAYPQDPTVPYAPSTFGPYNRFVRGTGTSEAAALTSGAVALMLSANPDLTADQVKNILKTTASPIDGTAAAVGSGEINLDRAYAPATAPKPTPFTQTGTVLKGGQIDDARGGTTNSKYTFHDFLLGYYEDTPGACTNSFFNTTTTGKYIGDPTQRQAISDAYYAGCHLEALRDRPTDPLATGGDYAAQTYTTGKWTGASKDIFGNAMNMTKLQDDETVDLSLGKLGKAWQKPSATATYEVWSADPALTIGSGWAPPADPLKTPWLAALGKVWADPPQSPQAWPGNWQRVQRKAFVTDTTLSWSTTERSWTGFSFRTDGFARFSFRAAQWARFSFTGDDWTGFSFRDNSWS
jgi:serine protease AprX